VNVFLWIAAGMLAAVLLAAGVPKLAKSRADLAASGQGWAEDFSSGTVKLIGVLEVLAAIGLLLPALLGIAPILVPLAAAGVVLLMIGAAVTHARRREYKNIGVNAILAALALIIAIFRFGSSSF
jgi:uncharacterized membrane protein YphA (DoxX/SURF4 family)